MDWKESERAKKNARVEGAIETDDHLLVSRAFDQVKFVTETVGWCTEVGCIKNDPELPVQVLILYATMNNKPIVFWSCCGRYADYTMVKEWLRKQFPRCTKFVDTLNVHQLIS
jgi:hypothetical protein